jgi:hypothetical protein
VSCDGCTPYLRALYLLTREWESQVVQSHPMEEHTPPLPAPTDPPQVLLPSALCPHTPEIVLLPSASWLSQLPDASPTAPLFLTWSKDAFEVMDAVADEQQGASKIGCVQGPAHTSFMSLEPAPMRDANVVV